MKLIDMTIEDFHKELASDSPAPGGGSVAAIEASFGCGLLSMVCELTARNKKFLETADHYRAIAAQADHLSKEALQTVDKDTEAFLVVSDAFSLPKETDEEKAVRRQTIQNGLKGCCYPPLTTMKIAVEGLHKISEMANSYNTSAASDLGSAVAALQAALQSAYLNVLINISGIKDADFVRNMEEEAEQLHLEGMKLGGELAELVADSLKTQVV